MANALLSLENIHHGFGDLTIIQDLNFQLQKGELVALTAPSGAGKTTFLHIAGLLSRPNQGKIWINNQDCWQMDEASRTKLRCHKIGFVFQFHYLMPELSARENIALALRLAGKNSHQANDEAQRMLEKVGLRQRANHLATELSGGEQQRIAIARALANRPQLLLADEPTGNLDPDNAQNILSLLLELIKENHTGALIVTHSQTIAAQCDKHYHLEHGGIKP